MFLWSRGKQVWHLAGRFLLNVWICFSDTANFLSDKKLKIFLYQCLKVIKKSYNIQKTNSHWIVSMDNKKAVFRPSPGIFGQMAKFFSHNVREWLKNWSFFMKSFFINFLPWAHRMQFWEHRGKIFDKRPKIFCSVSKTNEKFNFSQNFLFGQKNTVDMQMQFWQPHWCLSPQNVRKTHSRSKNGENLKFSKKN